MNQKVFVARLREARKEKGLTIQELADACGVSLSAMNRYVALTSQPTLEMACKIAQALGVSLDWLCGQEEKPGPPTMGLVLRVLSLLLTTTTVKLDHKIRGIMAADFVEDESGDSYIKINKKNLNNTIDFESWKKLLDLYDSQAIDYEMYSAWIEKKIEAVNRFHLPMDESDLPF